MSADNLTTNHGDRHDIASRIESDIKRAWVLMDGDPVTPELALREIRAWMMHRLQYGPIEHRRPDPPILGYHQHPSGYAAVLVPDWEMRQKLELVNDALNPVTAVLNQSRHEVDAPTRLTSADSGEVIEE